MINKIRSLLLGGADDNYLDILDKMKAIQDDAAACKLELSATSLRMQAKLEMYNEQTTQRLDSHEKRISKLERRGKETTGQHLLRVIQNDLDFDGLDKTH